MSYTLFHTDARYTRSPAGVAQSAEHFTRNEKVRGSIPRSGSTAIAAFWAAVRAWKPDRRPPRCRSGPQAAQNESGRDRDQGRSLGVDVDRPGPAGHPVRPGRRLLAARRRARVGVGRRADDAAVLARRRIPVVGPRGSTVAPRLPLLARRRDAVGRAAAPGVGAPRRRHRPRLASRRRPSTSDSVRWFGASPALAERVVQRRRRASRFHTHRPSRAPATVPTSSPRCTGRRRTTRPPRRYLDSVGRQRCRAICLPDVPTDDVEGTPPALIGSIFEQLRRQHGPRPPATGRLGARYPARPISDHRRRPARCSAPSPVRTTACRRRSPSMPMPSARSPRSFAASAHRARGEPALSAGCASSSPTTASIRGVSTSSSSTRTIPADGAVPPTSGPATRSPSRSPAAPHQLAAARVDRCVELAATVAAERRRARPARRTRPAGRGRARRRRRRRVPRTGARRPGAPGHRADRARAPRAGDRRRTRPGDPSPASDRSAGFNRETIVQWTLHRRRRATVRRRSRRPSWPEQNRPGRRCCTSATAGSASIPPRCARSAPATTPTSDQIEQLDAAGADGGTQPDGPAAARRRSGRGRRRPRTGR